jgi:type II secretory pathway pseudopilin PulG
MLNHRNKRRQAGDTLIEVLFAVTVFSLVVVTSLTLMNQGTSASLRSLQITLVRQEIDSQAEALRFLNAAYVSAYYPGYAPTTASAGREYYKIVQDISPTKLSVTPFGGTGGTCQTPPGGSFVINTRKATYDTGGFVKADTFPQIVYNTSNSIAARKGIWIEAVRSTPANGTRYVDFHIRACWDAPGTGQPMNLGTIVRLYEPAN